MCDYVTMQPYSGLGEVHRSSIAHLFFVHLFSVIEQYLLDLLRHPLLLLTVPPCLKLPLPFPFHPQTRNIPRPKRTSRARPIPVLLLGQAVHQHPLRVGKAKCVDL